MAKILYKYIFFILKILARNAHRNTYNCVLSFINYSFNSEKRRGSIYAVIWSQPATRRPALKMNIHIA